MFGLFKKDPVKKLQASYEAKLAEAMAAQRAGDMRLFSALSEQADSLLKEIQSKQEN